MNSNEIFARDVITLKLHFVDKNLFLWNDFLGVEVARYWIIFYSFRQLEKMRESSRNRRYSNYPKKKNEREKKVRVYAKLGRVASLISLH